MDSRSFLLEALELAKQAAGRGEVPVGALVVKDGVVIGRGSNTREAEQDPTGHAEMVAIREACRTLGSWRLVDCDLVVTLEPCPMCLAACQQARIRRVVYGARDPKGGALCLGFPLHDHPRLNHRFQVDYEPVEECGEVLRTFFRGLRQQE